MARIRIIVDILSELVSHKQSLQKRIEIACRSLIYETIVIAHYLFSNNYKSLSKS
jgi:hypothetical protein